MGFTVGRREELARVASWLDAGATVLVVGLPGSGRRSLAEACIAQRPEVRLATLADVAPGEPALVLSDRWVDGWRGALLRLGGLRREDALELWRRLDGLRGEVPGFGEAFRRSAGHPGALLAMRDGAAGSPELVARVDSLSPEARQAALALALHGGPAARELIAAADELAGALVIEPLGVGWAQLAPALAHPLQAQADAATLDAARRVAGELGAAVALRLGDADARRDLGARLVDRLVARLPRDRRSPELRRVRARALVGLGETGRALAIVSDLPDDTATRRLFAELAARAGRLAEAAAALELAPDPEVAALLDVLRGSPAPEHVAARVRAFGAWLHGDAEALERATEVARPDDDPELRAFAAIAAARRGDLAAAEGLVATLRDAPPDDEPRMAMLARLAEAHVDAAAGRRHAARDAFAELAARFTAAGELPFALGVQLEVAGLMFTLGHRRDAARLVAAVERRAREHGLLPGLGAALEQAAACELTRQVWRRGVEVTRPPAVVSLRQHAVAALQAAFAGHEIVAELHIAALADLPEGPDFAVERMLASLARAALGRLAASDAQAARHLAEARHHAAAGHVDAEQLAALVVVLGRERIVSTRGRRLVTGPRAQLHERSVIVDAVRHEIRGALPDGLRVIDLRRRPVLARLLYALAARPNEELDKDTLTIVLWGAPYNPLVHDNALKANVHRLNRMIAPAKISVSFGSHGYRLHGPPELVFVDRPASRSAGVTTNDESPMAGSRNPEH